MRSRFLSLVVVLVTTMLFSSVALAQDYDPRDFTGFWDRAGGPNGGSREIYGRGGSPPPMTAWGQEQYDAKRPGYGSRAVPPATGNDPVGRCNPQGVPRILLYPRPSEWVMLDDRLIQVFQWHRVFREVWIDGRETPEDFDPGIRRWLGYSAGRWEGNTLVVESAGFEQDQRTWLDHHGNVHSEHMRLTERYTRVSEGAIGGTILKDVDPHRVRARGGFSLLDLKRFVRALGYEGKGYGGLTLQDLVKIKMPAIIPVRFRDFDLASELIDR